MYVVANIGYNIALLLVIKYGSAALFYVASAGKLFAKYSLCKLLFESGCANNWRPVMLPLADICFTFEFIMGKDATPLSVYDIIGLVLILAGTIYLPNLGNADK